MPTHESLIITDRESGAIAGIAPSLGFNCHSFCVSGDDGPVELLWTAPGFLAGTERASGSGIPLLFPFPGRLEGTEFEFAGRRYSLEAGDGIGNAIHGFVLNRPWEVIEHTDDRLVGRFLASDVDANLLECWPSDWQLHAQYTVAGNRLELRVTVTNAGDELLPCGFGSHGYFRVPFGGRGSADGYRVHVPAHSYFELIDMLPTGRLLPTDEVRALAGGLEFAAAQLDDVFTALDFADGECRCSIDDTRGGRKLVVEFDDSCPHCVVYNPPHREAICIEPYTCVPDAYRLNCQAIETGLRVLKPGETFSCRLSITFTGAT
ncbi:MAG: aldose 1-epimerase [Pirellulales bacterium]